VGMKKAAAHIAGDPTVAPFRAWRGSGVAIAQQLLCRTETSTPRQERTYLSSMRALPCLVLLCAACPGAQRVADAPPASPPSLVGRFVHEGCVPRENADGTQSWLKLAGELSPQTWALDIVVFGDDACTTKYATMHIGGPYRIGAPSAAVPGGFEGDFVFAERTITPHVPGFVALLQSYSCGKAPYAVNEPQDVLERGCPELGFLPLAECKQDYDIVKLDGDTLTFGKRPADNNLCTPDKRPTELSALSFQRVP
jgi:hypothetical protein